jgi:hypothetical protein
MSRNASVRLSGRAFALAESPSGANFAVVVTDLFGSPWPDVAVRLDSFTKSYNAVTDSKGIARVTVPAEDILGNSIWISAMTPAGDVVQQQVDSSNGQKTPTALRFSLEQPKPLVTTIEAVVLAGGVIMAAFGFYKDHVVGNVVGGLGTSLAASAVLSSAKRHIWG